jgi:hypothetical protein
MATKNHALNRLGVLAGHLGLDRGMDHVICSSRSNDLDCVVTLDSVWQGQSRAYCLGKTLPGPHSPWESRQLFPRLGTWQIFQPLHMMP